MSGQMLHAQFALEGIDDNIRVIDAYDGERGYYVFYPSEIPSQIVHPVLFVHGYGALNPMIYGQWIRHLIENGHCVIYPRYQKDLLGTSSHDFVSNTSDALMHALEAIKEVEFPIDIQGVYLVGHSYGGVIIANLAAQWRSLGLPEPRIAFLCEPGSGPFTGGVLETYQSMDSALHVAIIVGDNDETVGQKFGQFVFESAINTPNRVLLWQYACAKDSLSVSASHYEPYAIDTAFDNGIENFTSRKAIRVARLDHVDKEGYWNAFDVLVEKERRRDHAPFAPHTLDQLSDLGTWPDGSALCKMGFHCPDPGNDVSK